MPGARITPIDGIPSERASFGAGSITPSTWSCLGPNSWLTSFYLGALKAGAEIAEYLGETDTAREWTAIFERGRAWVDAHLFNGEYYTQSIDLGDRRGVGSLRQGHGVTPHRGREHL